MIVLTSDLYTVRKLILGNAVSNMSLSEIDTLIAFNARSEFVSDAAYERIQEALRYGTNCASERGNRSMH